MNKIIKIYKINNYIALQNKIDKSFNKKEKKETSINFFDLIKKLFKYFPLINQ